MNTNQSSKSTTIPINRKWIELTLPNNKKLYYNKADDTVTIYPPFPKKSLATFLQVYNLGITESDFNSLLTQAITVRQTQSQTQSVDSTPITDLRALKSLEELSKYESIEKVLLQLFKIKYSVNPNYEYTSKDIDAKQRCTIKVKGASLLTGKEGKNKQEAKELVDRETLMMLLPKETYEVIRNNEIALKEKIITDEEEGMFDINERAPVIENDIIIKKDNSEDIIAFGHTSKDLFTNNEHQKEEPNKLLSKTRTPTPFTSSSSISNSEPMPKKLMLGTKHEREEDILFPNKCHIPESPMYEEEIASGCLMDEENYEQLDIDSPKILNEYRGTYKHSPSEVSIILYNK